MTYACEGCGFLFCRAGAVKECPSCGKSHIRPATGEEIGRLKILLVQGQPTLQIKEEQTL
jgi:hypothetical protein